MALLFCEYSWCYVQFEPEDGELKNVVSHLEDQEPILLGIYWNVPFSRSCVTHHKPGWTAK